VADSFLWWVKGVEARGLIGKNSKAKTEEGEIIEDKIHEGT